MMNKDYILRIVERLGRALAIILQLREFNKYEEALIYIDDLLLQTVGLTSSFINSITDEMLIQALSPLGELNLDKCLWVAALLKAEGDVYRDQNNQTECYYRYLKSLNLFLEAQFHERALCQAQFYTETDELLRFLSDYELPARTRRKLIGYYELTGHYAKAEDILFDLLEVDARNPLLRQEAEAFYTRLLAQSEYDLQAGHLSREEVLEGLAQLQERLDT
jgi:hypothetical protein